MSSVSIVAVVEVKDGFTIAVANRLVERGECKTLSEAVAFLAERGANNTPNFLDLPT